MKWRLFLYVYCIASMNGASNERQPLSSGNKNHPPRSDIDNEHPMKHHLSRATKILCRRLMLFYRGYSTCVLRFDIFYLIWQTGFSKTVYFLHFTKQLIALELQSAHYFIKEKWLYRYILCAYIFLVKVYG